MSDFQECTYCGKCYRNQHVCKIDWLRRRIDAERAAHERTRERLRAARESLAEIASRWSDETVHERWHGPDCQIVVCVAKRALAALAAPEAGGGE